MATQGGAGRCTTAPGTAAAIATSARSASNTGQTASKPTCAALSLRKDTPTARRSTAMTTPRSTDGSGPTTAAKPMTTTIATTADVRRPTRARWQSANTAAASNATLKPDTART